MRSSSGDVSALAAAEFGVARARPERRCQASQWRACVRFADTLAAAISVPWIRPRRHHAESGPRGLQRRTPHDARLSAASSAPVCVEIPADEAEDRSASQSEESIISRVQTAHEASNGDLSIGPDYAAPTRSGSRTRALRLLRAPAHHLRCSLMPTFACAVATRLGRPCRRLALGRTRALSRHRCQRFARNPFPECGLLMHQKPRRRPRHHGPKEFELAVEHRARHLLPEHGIGDGKRLRVSAAA